ncbi:unnamed protein product [Pleuronectes platessa]|uniref:Uncharacterized protein n=1 Tax=Pleuronectes platessa TaxID=8262 RepID=A0A9N7YH78_PLEPL|nr:unnamed protein product [Pleuronectes platessa]
MGVPGLVDKASCSREEAGLVVGGFGPDGPQPPAGGKNLKEFVTLLVRIAVAVGGHVEPEAAQSGGPLALYQDCRAAYPSILPQPSLMGQSRGHTEQWAAMHGAPGSKVPCSGALRQWGGVGTLTVWNRSRCCPSSPPPLPVWDNKCIVKFRMGGGHVVWPATAFWETTAFSPQQHGKNTHHTYKYDQDTTALFQAF